MKILITMMSDKQMEAILFPDAAPITVSNFVNNIKHNYYNGKTFHRIINNFMIQGGSLNGDGTGGVGLPITGEFLSNGIINPIGHYRGVLSMARTNDPNSADVQFFICHADCHFLDGNYAAFGVLTSGYDVLDEIATTPTTTGDFPIEPQIIKSIQIIEE